MLKSGCVIRTTLILAVVGTTLPPCPAESHDVGPIALTGQVTSQEEGPMEGVVVSAKGVGSNITVSVVTDDKGTYTFPKSRMKPNRYSVSIRAVGYEIGTPSKFEAPPKQLPQFLADKHTPAALVPVETGDKKTVHLDLRLVKTSDLASQLTKAEWIMSIPGTEEQKRVVAGNGGIL